MSGAGGVPGRPQSAPGGDPAENVRITRAILDGEPGAARDIAVLNAAAAIYAGGRAESVADGVRVAREAIDSGAAKRTLERYVELSNTA